MLLNPDGSNMFGNEKRKREMGNAHLTSLSYAGPWVISESLSYLQSSINGSLTLIKLTVYRRSLMTCNRILPGARTQ